MSLGFTEEIQAAGLIVINLIVGVVDFVATLPGGHGGINLLWGGSLLSLSA